MNRCLASLLLLLPSCSSLSSGKAPANEEALHGPQLSSLFASGTQVLGSLSYGQRSASVPYSDPPRYRGFTFEGSTGDGVSIWVRSSNGDAIAWLLDASYHVIAKNDDADRTTLDSHIEATLPVNGTYFIVFREFELGAATFQVQLDRGAGVGHSVSGTVRGDVAAGVAISLGGTGAVAISGSNGNYSFNGLGPGSYQLTPSKTGYTFSPAFIAVTLSGADVTGLDFTAIAARYRISGAVSGLTTAGVTLSLAGVESASATTDANGNYALNRIANGTYTLTPSKAGYVFYPANITVAVNGADLAGRNFAAMVAPIKLVVDPAGIAGMALDTTNVYWGNGTAVMKVPSGGGAPVTLASGTGVGVIGVDSKSVYWTSTATSGAVELMRTPVGGGNSVVVASGLNNVGAVVVDATSLYWTSPGTPNPGTYHTSNGTVMKMPLGGSSPTTLASGLDRPWSISVDAASVYWANNHETGSVMKVPIGGGTPTTLGGGYFPTGIAADANNVYWTDHFSNVMKVPIQGGTATRLASFSFGSISSADGIAVDETNVYWTNSFGGAVFRVPIGGGAQTLLAVGGTPEQIFVDATSIYWTDVRAGNIWKVTPK
jgi:hypothetical protein